MRADRVHRRAVDDGRARLLVLLVGAAAGLLMVVMRAPLRQAATLGDDMEAVI
ncbi:MAG: hypothetical protein L0I24_25490 [Pseudonocardia sp.]|nr:hypothetical protein [Pseudonocardia sp.]